MVLIIHFIHISFLFSNNNDSQLVLDLYSANELYLEYNFKKHEQEL